MGFSSRSSTSSKRKKLPAMLTNLRLDTVGAAIRLVTHSDEACESPRYSYFDDLDAPDTPYHRTTFANKFFGTDKLSASIDSQLQSLQRGDSSNTKRVSGTVSHSTEGYYKDGDKSPFPSQHRNSTASAVTLKAEPSLSSVSTKDFSKMLDEAVIIPSPELLSTGFMPHDTESVHSNEEARYLRQLAEFDKLRLKLDEDEANAVNPARRPSMPVVANTKTSRPPSMVCPPTPLESLDFRIPKWQQHMGSSAPPTPAAAVFAAHAASSQQPSNNLSCSITTHIPTTTSTTTSNSKQHLHHAHKDSITSECSDITVASDMTVSSSILFADQQQQQQQSLHHHNSLNNLKRTPLSPPVTPGVHRKPVRQVSTPLLDKFSTSPSSFSEASPKSFSGPSSPLLSNILRPRSTRDEKLDKLQRDLDSLVLRAREVRHEMEALEPVVKNPYKVEPEQRPVVKARYEQLAQVLETMDREKHDLGVKLTRAYRKGRETRAGGLSSFWVNS